MASFKEIINSKTPVLVDFFAEWCGPCKMMPPILKEIKSSLKDDVKILKIDVDKNQKIAAQHQVRGVPTLMLMRSGKVLWKQSGVMEANALHQIIQNHL